MFADRPATANPPHRADYDDRFHIERTTAQWLAAAFVLYGLVATAFLAINMPPFQNPDEPAHFERAAQIADGGLIATRFSTPGADGSQHVTAGGSADPALMTAFSPFNALIFHPDTRATRSSWALNVHWSNARVMTAFPNTAMYPPLFYAPSAIGVSVGRFTRMTVVQTLIVSRLLTGVVAVTIGAAAIACAGGAAAWLFTILTLPMSLSLIASPSQDALILTCSALAGALLVRALRWPSALNRKMLAGLTVTLGLVAMARPPYGALALLPLALSTVRLRSRILAAAAVLLCAAAWSGITAATTSTNFGDFVGADPAAQMARLRGDPLLVVHVAWNTLTLYWRGYLIGFVGQLGWLDTALPRAYHQTAKVMLGVAAMAAMLGIAGERISPRSRMVIAAGLLLSLAGVFGALYLTWTVPGNATVEGVQGRYFLPIALVGAVLLPALGQARWRRPHSVLLAVVAGFPVVTLAVVMRAVILRYYLG